MAAFDPLLLGKASSQPLPLRLTVAIATAGASIGLAAGRSVYLARVLSPG